MARDREQAIQEIREICQHLDEPNSYAAVRVLERKLCECATELALPVLGAKDRERDELLGKLLAAGIELERLRAVKEAAERVVQSSISTAPMPRDHPMAALRAALVSGESEPSLLEEDDGAALIAAERLRQEVAEGWTLAHDDKHRSGALRQAARAYASDPWPEKPPPPEWPWEPEWWKPSRDPIRNLVKAGALLAAEIDRLQRDALDPSPRGENADG